MSKYDFGYDIQKGSTTEWAFNSVQENSRVLEIGPAVGTLTKHLKEDKQCIVDIIEIDEESGKRAARFARFSCIGLEQGDVEKDIWYAEVQDQQYDYIVILDVLEHLKNAPKLLERLKKLLKDDGVLLISVPNMAHNSIIIELYCNKFNYTDVGLLDKTHVHFYSYESLGELLHETGWHPFEKGATQLRVGENEIRNAYEDLPVGMRAALRTREYADVYQFLFKAHKKAEADCEVVLETENLPYTLYEFLALDSLNNILMKQKLNPRKELCVQIPTSSTKDVIRITPINDFCILKGLKITGITESGDEVSLSVNRTNAAQINDLFVFASADPQIFVEKPDGIVKILVNAEFLSFANDDLKWLLDFWKKILEQKDQIEELSDTQKKLYEYIDEKEKYGQELLTANMSYVSQIHNWEKYTQELLAANESYVSQIHKLEERLQSLTQSEI